METVIFKTDEDRQRFIYDSVVPDYLSEETKQLIASRQWDVFEEFIFPRWRKKAREEQRYPVWLCELTKSNAGTVCLKLY